MTILSLAAARSPDQDDMSQNQEISLAEVQYKSMRYLLDACFNQGLSSDSGSSNLLLLKNLFLSFRVQRSVVSQNQPDIPQLDAYVAKAIRELQKFKNLPQMLHATSQIRSFTLDQFYSKAMALILTVHCQISYELLL